MSQRISDPALRSLADYLDRSNIHYLPDMKSGAAADAIKTLAIPGFEADLVDRGQSLVKMQTTKWVTYVRQNQLLSCYATKSDRESGFRAWRTRYEEQELPRLVETIKFRFESDDLGFIMRQAFNDCHEAYLYASAIIGKPYPEAPNEDN